MATVNELQQILNDILADKNTNLLPDNLREGVECLGINGVYEGGAKLFATIDEMNQDENAKIDDLAIIYRKEINNMTTSTKTQYLYFPETVTLPAAVTYSDWGMVRGSGTNGYFDGQTNISPTAFMFDGYGSNVDIRVQYTSEDGITYTRQTNVSNPFDCGCEVQVYNQNYWTDDMGYFVQAEINTFEGLFQNYFCDDVDYIKHIPLSNISLEGNVFQWNGKFSDTLYSTEKILTICSKMKTNNIITTDSSFYCGIDADGDFVIYGYFIEDYNAMNGNAPVTMITDKNYNIIGISDSIMAAYNDPSVIKSYKLDFDNMTYSLKYSASNTGRISDTSQYYAYGLKMGSVLWHCNNKKFSFVSPRFRVTEVTQLGGDITSVVVAGSSFSAKAYPDTNKYFSAPTQLSNVQADEVLEDVTVYGSEGVVKGDGTIYDNLDEDLIYEKFCGDATATPNDIIAPQTAYGKNGEMTGTIIPAYETTLPEQYNRQISYSVTLNDADLEFNIGIYCSATTLCRIYRLNDTTINSSYTSVSNSNFSSITFYTNQATLSHVPTLLNGKTYLRAYVAAKNSSNKVGIASFLIDIETLACSNFLFRQVASASWNNGCTSSNTPSILNVPTTNNRCLIAYFAIGSADAWTHYQMMTFNASSSSTKFLVNVGNNTSNTAQGLSDFRWNFSPDGKTLGAFSNMTRMWGNPHYWTLILKFSDDYNSFDEIKKTVDNTKPLSKYSLLINDELFANGSSMYDIDAPTTRVDTLPFTPAATCNGMQLGKYYFYVSSTSATTMNMYTVEDTDLTLATSTSIKANQVFYHPSKDIVFVTGNNNITGYKLGEQGTLIGIKRLDVNYYNTYNADATAADLLSNKIAYSNSGKIKGTMTNRGAVTITPTRYNRAIAKGYHNGSGYVLGDTNLIAANIRADKTIFGITGRAPITFSTVEELEANVDFPENTLAIVYGTTYIGTYKLDGGAWTQIGDSSEGLQIFETLQKVLATSDEYEGEGGTDAEINAVLDTIIGNGGNA